MFEIIFQRLWNTLYSFFRCFKQPETIKHDNELEYGKLPDLELSNTNTNTNPNKITIQIPKYEFVLLED
jgi:hypothetical protein